MFRIIPFVCLILSVVVFCENAYPYERPVYLWSCGDIKGLKDGLIVFDLKQDLAGFFNGRITKLASYKESKLIQVPVDGPEGYHFNKLYIFDNSSRMDMSENRVRITFNESAHSARVILFEGSDTKHKKEYASTSCEPDPNVTLSPDSDQLPEPSDAF